MERYAQAAPAKVNLALDILGRRPDGYHEMRMVMQTVSLCDAVTLVEAGEGFALFALVPIWLYQGRQGLHGKVFRWFCYAFYPVHMLILFIIRGQMLG